MHLSISRFKCSLINTTEHTIVRLVGMIMGWISIANAKRLWGRVGWMLADHRDGLSSSSFIAWSSIAQSVCQRAFSLLAIWCLRLWWVRILPSAEEDNLFPLDSNIACLCQSIEINNNKHVYRQSQVRMPNGCGVEWAECSLIIGTGCRVQVL